MRHRVSLVRLLSLLVSLPFSLAPAALVLAQDATPLAMPPAGVTVIASGLTNPRGFAWGPDGTLYLALAGTGGNQQVVIQSTPMPLFEGQSASIVSVANGCTTALVDGLPSLHFADVGWTFGISALAMLDGTLYALSTGGGASDSPNGIYRVGPDGSWTLFANLQMWFVDHPPTFRSPDYDPSGSLFDMEAGKDRLWITEAVGGRLLTVTPDGTITLVADLSEGHMVPDGLALDGHGGAYVGFETTPPYTDGSSKVVHVTADGKVTDAWTGLTALTDVEMGPDGMLYAAEMASNNLDQAPFLRPNSGRVVRQTGPDSLEPVVTDVPYPVYLGFDSAGTLYLDYPAFGENRGEGLGALVSIDISSGTPISLAGMAMTGPTCLTGAATPAPSPMPVATPVA
jgi:sugar lactone lactonase YvrE